MKSEDKLEHPSGLTLKAQAAVEHYLVHGEKSAAYLHGYGRKRCNQRVWESLVHRFFDRPKVLAEVKRRRALVSEQVDIRVEDVIRRLSQYGLAKPPAPLEDAEDGIPSHLVATIDGNTFAISAETSMAALKLLGIQLGMFEKKRQAISDVPLFNIVTVPIAVPMQK